MSLTTFLKRGYNMKETDELFKLATITLTGAVLLGKSVVCDGYSEGRTTAVFTHIHKDHSEAVPTCLGRCDNVYSSKPTLDMLKSLYGEHVGRRFNFEAIDYNSSRMPESEKITLLESRHMLGAAQVLVETSNQIKLVYSSDFTSKDSIPHKCNVLVIEFVGKNGVPTKNLLESKEVNNKDFDMAISILKSLYKDAKLVHADFSEYNIFKTEKGLVVFDLGSAVDIRHPNSTQFLKRDINNITNFFVRRGLTIQNPADTYDEVIK